MGWMDIPFSKRLPHASDKKLGWLHRMKESMRNHLGLSLIISRVSQISLADQLVHESGVMHLISFNLKNHVSSYVITLKLYFKITFISLEFIQRC